MNRISTFHFAWVIVGCVFAEATYMIVQIILTLLTNPHLYNLDALLSPDNPLYALPPLFYIVAGVFLLIIIIGEWKHIYNASYYIIGALVAALIYTGTLHVGHYAPEPGGMIINLIAAAGSGFIYWLVTPRRFNRLSLNTTSF